MKIGILTYHSAKNYGAFLQAYALRNAIIELTGNNVEIINFEMPQAEAFYKAIVSSAEGKEAAYLEERYQMFEREEKLSLSNQSRLVSDDISDFHQLVNGKYDILIAGSDEIWKMDGFRGFPNPYWLPGDYKSIKYSYAVSSRNDYLTISEADIEKVKELLSDFSYVGVRDKATFEFIKKTTGIIPHLNCDPTFVYDFKLNRDLGKWLIRNRFHISEEKKVIALMIENDLLYNAITQMYGSYFDFIPIHYYGFGLPNAILTPFEWMQVIAGADGLICNHFHGTVFALKANTPFIAFELRTDTDKYHSKIYDLLSRHDLENHFYILDNPVGQSLREIGTFLAGIIEGSEQVDFQEVCEKERKLFSSFLDILPDNKKKHVTPKEENCCGCSACITICSVDAIKVEIDDKGFWYPCIDDYKCIKCGRCNQICPFFNNNGNKPKQVYGIKHKNEVVRKKSRSGGAFTGFSDAILREKGVVYGCSFTKDFLAKQSRASSAEERDSFCGSKYIQSNMTGIYDSLKSDLDNGKKCLFSGTPCQVAAVKNYFGENENLFMIDIVCLGTPSPMVWKDYLEYQEIVHKGKIEHVEFRDKRFGWKAHKESFVIKGNLYDADIFANLFLSHLTLRPSCFNCPYKCIERQGDITLADFWGIDAALPDFDDDKGVSLVMVNTDKGEELFEKAKDSFIWRKTELKHAMQNSLRFSYPKPIGYEEFWDEYKNTGIEGVILKREQVRKEERLKKIEERKSQRKRQIKQKIKHLLGNVWRIAVGE